MPDEPNILQFERISKEELAQKMWAVIEADPHEFDLEDNGLTNDPNDLPFAWTSDHGKRLPETPAEKIECLHPSLQWLTPQIREDLKKVEFDGENVIFLKSDTGRDPTQEIIGLQERPNGLTYFGVIEGGDWETAIFYIIYWDGTDLRGYIPEKGNYWNRNNGKAIGNDDEGDAKSLGVDADTFDPGNYWPKAPELLDDIDNKMQERGVAAEPKNREAIYDEQISPLMAKVIEICKEHDIPILASFQLDDDRSKPDLMCTTAIVPKDANPVLKAAHRAVYKPTQMTMLTVKNANGEITRMESHIG